MSAQDSELAITAAKLAAHALRETGIDIGDEGMSHPVGSNDRDVVLTLGSAYLSASTAIRGAVTKLEEAIAAASHPQS